MSKNNREFDKMLDKYIYDYLVKKNLSAAVEAFEAESKESTAAVAIDSPPGGFLLEWWFTFWDMFAANTHASPNKIDTQLANVREVEGHQQELRMHMQQMFNQKILYKQQVLYHEQQQQWPIDGSTDTLVEMPQQQLQKTNQQQQYCTQHTQLWSSYLQPPGGMSVGGSMSNTYNGNEQMPQQQLEKTNQQQQYCTQHTQLWSSYLQPPGGMTVDDSMSNTYRGNEQIGGKNKQVMSKFGCDSWDDLRGRVTHSFPASEVECCDFSHDGTLLAIGGRDNKVVLWSTSSLSNRSTLEEHSQRITDVRFSRTMPMLATSSADKTVKVWSAHHPEKSRRTFEGHSSTVLSVDFYTANENIVCSCDESEIRSWSIVDGYCIGIYKELGGARQLRFQPRQGGKLLAAAKENVVHIRDEGGEKYLRRLAGDKEKVECICWERSGLCLASVSADMVKVWMFESSGGSYCLQQLSCTGSKFHTCGFHPNYNRPVVLVIGCDQGIEFWNIIQNKRTAYPLEYGVSAMAISNIRGCYATVIGGGKYVRLWMYSL